MWRPTAGYSVLAAGGLVDAFASAHAVAFLGCPQGLGQGYRYALSCSQGLVPEQSIMSLDIVGLSITVQRNRPVEPPGGHLLAPQLGSSVKADLSKAHDISVTPIFAHGAGRPIPMAYRGRGASRDVWEGQDDQLGGRAVLKVCDLPWEASNVNEFNVLRTFHGRIRVPKQLWLGKAPILGKDRVCLLATSGCTDALVALNGCLRAQEEPLRVAEWAVDFLVQAINFLIDPVEKRIFPGGSWTLWKRCITSPVPGPPSELVLVGAAGVERSEDVHKLPSKLKKVWRQTVREFLLIISSAPTEELRLLAGFVSRACPEETFCSPDYAVAALKAAKEQLPGAIALWARQIGLHDTATVGAASLSTRGLSRDSGRLTSTAAAASPRGGCDCISCICVREGVHRWNRNLDGADLAAEHGVRICGRDGWVLAPGQGGFGPLEQALECWCTGKLQPARAGAPETTLAPGSAARPCVPEGRRALALFQELCFNR